MGRQALARLAYERTNYPLSGSLARCPGSLRTNFANSHPRAGFAKPTSAQGFKLDIESWLDHPRFYNLCDATIQRTGPANRRKLEAANGFARIFEKLLTVGSILAQGKIAIHRRVFHGSGAGLS